MESLEVLLEQNYDGIVDPGCVIAVLTFVDRTQDVSDRDIVVTKRLVKVLNHILTDRPDAIAPHLTTAFSYCVQGIEKIARGETNGYTPGNVLSMRAHLHAYAGNFAEAILERTDSQRWGSISYEQRRTAGELVAETDPLYSAYVYGLAGNVCWSMAKRSRHNLVWHRRAVESYRRFLEYCDTHRDEIRKDSSAYRLMGLARKGFEFLQGVIAREESKVARYGGR